MAILGGGGQSVDDPVYVDTLESLKEALADEVKLYKYIAFPEVYDAPKVIDLRSAGWNPINIVSPFISGSNRNDVYIYFNNWTILGLSMMDSISEDITFFSNEIRTYIYDLIIKNAYILAATSEAAMFECASNANLTPITNFYRCKFSMCLDAQNSDVTAFHGYPSGTGMARHMNFYQCSFNTNYVMNTSSLKTRLYHQNYTEGSFTNCIFNVVASHHRGASGYSNYLIGTPSRMQFCKVIGSIEHISGNKIDILNLRNSGGSVYNVIDMSIIDRVTTGNTTLYIRFGSGTNIINSSKVSKAPEASTYALNKDYTNLTECTAAQMQDKDYLNSIEFICGDAVSP